MEETTTTTTRTATSPSAAAGSRSSAWSKSKIRSRSFVMDRMDAHFFLRTNAGEYKKTRWTELGVARLREDLDDALNYVDEMRNLIVLLEKEEAKYQKMPAMPSGTGPSAAAVPPAAVSHLISSAPVPLHAATAAKGGHHHHHHHHHHDKEKEETKDKDKEREKEKEKEREREKRTKSKRMKRPKDKTGGGGKKKERERGVMDRLNNFLSSAS